MTLLLVRALTKENLALGVAVLFGCFSLVAILNRMIRYHAARSNSRQYAPLVTEALRTGNLSQAIELSKSHPKSHVARVVAVGLETAQQQQQAGATSDQIVRRAERSMNREMELVGADLKRGLGIMKVAAGVTPVFALVYSQRAAIITGVIFVAPAIWMSISSEIRCNSYLIEMKNSASEVVDYLDRTVH
jgi:biopolymer transport protein ExbB/biopolymer transport protein TolQ